MARAKGSSGKKSSAKVHGSRSKSLNPKTTTPSSKGSSRKRPMSVGKTVGDSAKRSRKAGGRSLVPVFSDSDSDSDDENSDDMDEDESEKVTPRGKAKGKATPLKKKSKTKSPARKKKDSSLTQARKNSKKGSGVRGEKSNAKSSAKKPKSKAVSKETPPSKQSAKRKVGSKRSKDGVSSKSKTSKKAKITKSKGTTKGKRKRTPPPTQDSSSSEEENETSSDEENESSSEEENESSSEEENETSSEEENESSSEEEAEEEEEEEEEESPPKRKKRKYRKKRVSRFGRSELGEFSDDELPELGPRAPDEIDETSVSSMMASGVAVVDAARAHLHNVRNGSDHYGGGPTKGGRSGQVISRYTMWIYSARLVNEFLGLFLGHKEDAALMNTLSKWADQEAQLYETLLCRFSPFLMSGGLKSTNSSIMKRIFKDHLQSLRRTLLSAWEELGHTHPVGECGTNCDFYKKFANDVDNMGMWELSNYILVAHKDIAQVNTSGDPVYVSEHGMKRVLMNQVRKQAALFFRIVGVMVVLPHPPQIEMVIAMLKRSHVNIIGFYPKKLRRTVKDFCDGVCDQVRQWYEDGGVMLAKL